jgi:hypothetical protein
VWIDCYGVCFWLANGLGKGWWFWPEARILSWLVVHSGDLTSSLIVYKSNNWNDTCSTTLFNVTQHSNASQHHNQNLYLAFISIHFNILLFSSTHNYHIYVKFHDEYANISIVLFRAYTTCINNRQRSKNVYIERGDVTRAAAVNDSPALESWNLEQ